MGGDQPRPDARASIEDDYRWLTDVYESVRPSDITGRLVWHALGAKTIDLINEHVLVEVRAADLETIVLDAQTIEDLMIGKRTDVPPKEIEKQITARIARHLNNPVFVELGKRLNELREKYADIQQSSLDFLRELLELARDTVAAEKAVNEMPREEQGKAALTELFEALKTDGTPVIVENIVNRIDEVVRGVRFEGWQSHASGATRRSGRPSARRSTSSSRSATTTSSKRPSATSGSTTDVQRWRRRASGSPRL